MSNFDKSAFFAAAKPKTVSVSVDGFGLVSIVQLRTDEVIALREKHEAAGKSVQFGLLLVAASVVDDAGMRVFDDSDLEALKRISNAVMEILIGKAFELAGFKAVGAEKN